jgi:hypothetical protein
MIDPALRKLRLDRRMLDRRSWIAPKDLERELAALPDVSAKIAPVEEPAAAEASPPSDTAGAAR